MSSHGRPIFHKPIHHTIAAMADSARMGRRAPPVIETDYESAKILCKALQDSLGCADSDLIGGGPVWPFMMRYDGVKIVVRKISPEELYREHFGVLADIWAEVDKS